MPTWPRIISGTMVGFGKELFADHFLLAIFEGVRDILDAIC